MQTTIYIDADACPVKRETYKVAVRYQLPVRLVANQDISVPPSPLVLCIVVGRAIDAADDWIAEQAGAADIVITADILLAARCLDRGARVLGPYGRQFTHDSIGDAVASRALRQELRESGVNTGGPPPMTKRDRSRFLARLDELVNAIRREQQEP